MQAQERKILLVGDGTFVSRAYQVGLEQSGFGVHSVYRGDEVVDKIRSEKPDLILVDLIILAKDELDVLGEINADMEGQIIPIIVFSSLGRDLDIERASEIGAVDYLFSTDVSVRKLIDKIGEYFPG